MCVWWQYVGGLVVWWWSVGDAGAGCVACLSSAVCRPHATHGPARRALQQTTRHQRVCAIHLTSPSPPAYVLEIEIMA